MPDPPAADAWVEESPVLGAAVGMARLSAPAVVFITSLESLLTAERSLRKVEHACWDEAEAKGLIKQ